MAKTVVHIGRTDAESLARGRKLNGKALSKGTQSGASSAQRQALLQKNRAAAAKILVEQGRAVGF